MPRVTRNSPAPTHASQQLTPAPSYGHTHMNECARTRSFATSSRPTKTRDLWEWTPRASHRQYHRCPTHAHSRTQATHPSLCSHQPERQTDRHSLTLKHIRARALSVCPFSDVCTPLSPFIHHARMHEHAHHPHPQPPASHTNTHIEGERRRLSQNVPLS